MKTFIKIAKWTGIILVLLIALAFLYFLLKTRSIRKQGEEALGPPAPTLVEEGISYRDLNKNGRLDAYENPQAEVSVRVDDLLGQMTLEEKAAQLFHPFQFSTGSAMMAMRIMARLAPPEMNIGTRKLSHLTSSLAPDDPLEHIRWANRLQELAERTRLGIPVSLSSDPRHSNKKGAALFMRGLTQWPDALGFAALRDSALTYRFGQITAREYRAIGLHTGLHPVADLATEPRWARIAGTYGSKAELSARLTTAYIRGIQGDSLTAGSVAAMTKHFPGGGPQKDGWDAHFKYGKDQAYPGDRFDYHLTPFKAAIRAGTAQMMPYYGIGVGQTSEDVGFAFNREIITGLLRDSLGFEGIVCTDWGIIRDPANPAARFTDPMDHGVEALDAYAQVEKALKAGVDQFGGSDNPELVVRLVREGRIPESRIDESVRRLLAQKFRLGLFDGPYVDEATALAEIRRPEDVRLGLETMIASSVLLKNKDNTLPLPAGARVYVHNMDEEIAGRFFQLADNPESADYAIYNLPPAFEPREGLIEGFFHQGRLHYLPEELQALRNLAAEVPTVVVVYLERPLILTDVVPLAEGVLGHFSSSEEALFQVISGNGAPEGRLPFELPASPRAVERQLEDVPDDSDAPLFPYGFGLSYD